MKFKLITGMYAVMLAASANGYAGAIYNPGQLNFTLSNQSIWEDSTGVVPTEYTASQSWNSSSTFGHIAGSSRALITPAVPSFQLTPYIPATYAPSWHEARVHIGWNFKGERIYAGCGCRRGGGKLTNAIPATYSPSVPAVYADTRTGSLISLSSSGSVGIKTSLGLNSGTLDASLTYNTSLKIPGRVKPGEFFSLQQENSLSAGSLDSIFPKLTGKVEFSMAHNATAAHQSCFIGTGCSGGSGTIMNFDTGYLPLLELNTANVPDKMSLFGLDALAFDITKLTLWADYNPLATPPVTISLPGVTRPPLAINIGALTLDYPDLTLHGGLSGNKLVSSGVADNLIRLDADLDGIATATGSLPPLGFVANKGPLTFRLDGVDIDLGPTIDLKQDLELTPALMVRLDFSDDVYVRDHLGNISIIRSWQGKSDDMPEFALTEIGQEIRVTPTYWAVSDIMNKMDLGLDLTLGLDMLKGQAFLSLFSTPEFCVQCRDYILPVADIPFQQFNFSSQFRQMRTASSFILNTISEPAQMALFGIGLFGVIAMRRKKRKKDI